MRAATVLTVFLSLVLVACGGKKKNKTTGPDTQPVVEERDTTPKDNDQGDGSDGSDTDDPAKSLKNVIYFEFDQADLSDDSRQILTNNAEWLKEDPSRKLTIEGHTDETGTTEYNLGLGERRAREAREYLIRLGIEAERVKIITYGEEKPTSEEDSLNRRSMFIATAKKQ